MNPKQLTVDAFQLKTPEDGHIPVTMLGGGVWMVRRRQRQFSDLFSDP